jgi:hypothetical protein
MARLTADQWGEARALWEASPRQGLEWLTRAAGGPFDVSAEGIRKRRLKEGWAKVELTSDLVRDAHDAADRLAAERLRVGTSVDAAARLLGCAETPAGEGSTAGPKSVVPPTLPPVPSPAQMAADPSRAPPPGAPPLDVVAHFSALHKRDWQVIRGLMAEAVRTRDLERARLAKVLLDGMAALHAGEREDNGLNADPLDYSEASTAELEAIAAGRRPGPRRTTT